MKTKIQLLLPFTFVFILFFSCSPKETRIITDFNNDWKFFLGDGLLANQPGFDDAKWRSLDLPHDWSIEGEFSEENTTKQAGGGLPAGIGWYRKNFTIPGRFKNKNIFIDFDGIYRNSEVWINGNYLGKRPYGYISFRYELTPYLFFGEKQNVIAVKADNSDQPNSRWYTGSGIYRNVRLTICNGIMVDHWGTFITSDEINKDYAVMNNRVVVANNSGRTAKVTVQTKILNKKGKIIAKSDEEEVPIFDKEILNQKITVKNPRLWSVQTPELYIAVTTVKENNKIIDEHKTRFGIRYFSFNAEKGFTLNGNPLKILGVCNHHDLGALGAAVNKSAIERQLVILKKMGCNAIRTAHNPPAPELLDLCDEMGFLVVDEAFDAWKKKKAKKDYHLEWDKWHKRDLQDLIKRDRNHPSVIMWSIGNEIREQFDSTGTTIAKELVKIVKDLDATRPVTCALTENIPEKNFIYQSAALDVLSFNYKQNDYKNFPGWYPGEAVIASENMSAFASRGCYNMPSDSIQRWPEAHGIPLKNPNPDYTISAYDHISAYWGSTHEETWCVVKELDFISGLFIWSGFDFIGEPVPYGWPARSSYYGIIDLAGFPKDAYYMYQSEWSDKTMLHVFPHWNWKKGEIVDVWAYYNNADEAELFVNGVSKGIRSKNDTSFHVTWRVKFEEGDIRVVTRESGKKILEKTIETADKPAMIHAIPNKNSLIANSKDLVFIEVQVLDNKMNLVPYADNLVTFNIDGPGKIVGVDNGFQADLTSMKGNRKKAFKGKCLVILQSGKNKGPIKLNVSSEGLESNYITINSN